MREDSWFHGVIFAWWCSVSAVCVVMGEWVGERVSDFVILWRIVPVPKRSESRWQKNSPAWLGTSPSPTVYFLPCLCSHFFDSHTALAWYPRLRRTNEDVSLLLKTMAVTKMTVSFPSFLPPSHPLPPPRQMDRGESQTVFFKSIFTLVLIVCARMGLWNGKVFLQNWHL